MIGVLRKRKSASEEREQRSRRLATEKFVLDRERASITRSRESLRMEWERLEADRPLLSPRLHERIGHDLLSLSKELDEREKAFLRRYKTYRQEKPIWWDEKVVQKKKPSYDTEEQVLHRSLSVAVLFVILSVLLLCSWNL